MKLSQICILGLATGAVMASHKRDSHSQTGKSSVSNSKKHPVTISVILSQDVLCGYYNGQTWTQNVHFGKCNAVPDDMPEIQTINMLNWTAGYDHCDLWATADCTGPPSPQGPYGLGSGIASVYGPPGKQFAICGSATNNDYIKGYQCYSEEDGTNPYA